MSRLPSPPNARVDGLDAGAANLAAFLVHQVEGLSPGAQASRPALQKVLAARAREARRRSIRRTAGIGVTVGALAAGLVFWTMTNRAPVSSPLSYTVDGAAAPGDGYLRSSATHQRELAFSDGTSIQMMPATQARVVDVGSRGARLVLEEGRAHVHVVHRPGADWQVQAGSFVVHVHGTAFVVGWSAAEARFDLQMESGVVSVDGPRSMDSIILRAGQSVSLRPDGSPTSSIAVALPAARATDARGPGAPPDRGEQLPPAIPPDSPPALAPHPVPSANQPRARWSERLADGDAAGVVAEAQRRGVSDVLSTASSEDLAALADAARFQMQDRLARRVLLTHRVRFPGTLRAKEASFLLGRLAEGQGGRAADALTWYDRYLQEAPSGAYAAEAMGRMMIVLDRQQRSDQARAVAATYLRRFPQGVYARAARGVLSR